MHEECGEPIVAPYHGGSYPVLIGAALVACGDGYYPMYRVVAIVGAGLAVAACSSTSNGAFGFGPTKEAVRFESEPPGAEAKTSTGESCRTPCAIAMPTDKGFSVTFSLTGYKPATEELQLASMSDGTSQLRPNPVIATLAAVPPPKKKARAMKTVAKPAPKSKPVAAAPPAATPAASPTTTWVQQPQKTSPWPATPSPQAH
jgi:hypothetical protein